MVRESQVQPNSKNKGSVDNEILANIRLDSPTTSYETRNERVNTRYGHEDQLISTPFRVIASSLVALGKHEFTSRQGRSWTYGNKSLPGR